jgi:hypothetical protein
MFCTEETLLKLMVIIGVEDIHGRKTRNETGLLQTEIQRCHN